MRFRTSRSLQSCRDYLMAQESKIQVLADTEVEITGASGAFTNQFTIKRMWKGMKGIFRYPVTEAVGDLKRIDDNITEVDVTIQLREMGYVAIVVGIAVGILAWSDVDNRLYLFVPAILLGLLVYDFIVLREVIDNLRNPS